MTQIPAPNNTGTVNALLDDFFDDTPIYVLQQTLTDLANLYSKYKVQQSGNNDSPFLIENTIYQVGIIKDLLLKLADIHSGNERALNWRHTLQNQLN